MSVRVQAEDFDLGAELTSLTAGNPAIGGLASFVGLVRDIHGGEAVTATRKPPLRQLIDQQLRQV